MNVKQQYSYDILAKSVITDTTGAKDQGYSTSVSGAKGYFEFLSGMAKTVGRIEHSIDYRLYDFEARGITTANRISYNSRTYNVIAVDSLPGKNKHDEVYLVDVRNDIKQKSHR